MGSRIADASGAFLLFIYTTLRLGIVLDEQQTVLGAELFYVLRARTFSIKVYEHNGTCVWSHCLFDLIVVKLESVFTHINEHGCQSIVHYCSHGGDERMR